MFFQQGVDPAALSAAVSHFLNCFLSSSPCFLDSCSDELASRRRSRRRRSQRGRVASLKDNMWCKLTPTELWSRIRSEARDYFHYMINRCVWCGCWWVVCRMLQSSCFQWKYRWGDRETWPPEDLPTERDRYQNRHPGQTSSLLWSCISMKCAGFSERNCCVEGTFPPSPGTAEGVRVWLPTQADVWWGRCYQHVPCGQTSHAFRSRSRWAGATCTGSNSPGWETNTAEGLCAVCTVLWSA